MLCKYCSGNKVLKHKQSGRRIPCVCVREDFVQTLIKELGLDGKKLYKAEVRKTLAESKTVVYYGKNEDCDGYLNSLAEEVGYGLKELKILSYSDFASKYTNNSSLEELLSPYLNIDYLVFKVSSHNIIVVGSIPKAIVSILFEREAKGLFTIILSYGEFSKVETKLNGDFCDYTKDLKKIKLGSSSSGAGKYDIQR